jgi:hypothetical protein
MIYIGGQGLILDPESQRLQHPTMEGPGLDAVLPTAGLSGTTNFLISVD